LNIAEQRDILCRGRGGVEAIMSRAAIARHTHEFGMCLLLILVVFHASLTPIMFKSLSGQLVWYVATDLGNLYFLFLNFAVTRMSAPDRIAWRLCHTANALGVGLGVFNLIAVDDPINIVVLVAFLAISLGGLGRDGAPTNPISRWVQASPS
jgi:hypothetical protein